MSKFNLKVPSNYKEIEIFEFSDTHNESRAKDYPSKKFYDETFWVAPNNSKDVYSVLVLAGDIFNLKKVGIAYDLLSRYCDTFDLVLYVFGNHEYYGTKIGRAEEKLKERTKDLKNLYILQNDRLDLQTENKTFVFLGSTMWFNFHNDPDNQRFAMRKVQGMNGDVFAIGDFQFIKSSSYSQLKPHHINNEFSKSLRFLSSELSDTNSDDFVCVVTHHAPTLLSATHFIDKGVNNPVENKMELDDVFNLSEGEEIFNVSELDEYSFMYVSDLRNLIFKFQPDVWFHGHIHKKRTYKLNKTLVSCNPIGYKGESGTNKAYKPSKLACLKFKLQ